MTTIEPRGWFARAARYHLDRSPVNQSFRLARGKPTTWHRLVIDADLPPAVDGAIQRIARRTRVLPFEKAAFVAELIAHCQDALDAGVDPDDAARSMGPPDRVGRLATRAIRRKRPPLVAPFFTAFRWAKRMAVTAVSVYVLAAIWFFARSPAVTVDHLAELNAPLASVPPEDRAAPLVAEVSERVSAVRESLNAPVCVPGVGCSAQDTPQWALSWPDPEHRDEDPAAFDAVLIQAAPAVARAREAAARPHLGVVWSLYDEEFRPELEDALDHTLIGVLLPYLGRYRLAARLLVADARRAAEAADRATVTANLVGTARLSRQLTEDDPFFISNLVAWAIHGTAARETLRILHRSPALFDEKQLAALDAALDIEFEAMGDGERRMYEDLVQRSYAPGEHGRITPDGWRLISDITSFDFLGVGPAQNPDPSIAVAPIIAPFMASRGDTLGRQRATLQGYQAAAARTVAFPSTPDGVRQLEQLKHRAPITDPLARTVLPATVSALNSLQRARTQRDVARFAIAIHRHRVRTGDFPAAAEMIDASIPSRIPPDRFTGDPMAYRLTDGGPLIYVTGPDRDDDGGRPISPQRRGDNTGIVDADDFFPVAENRRPDGDWVLFPPDAHADR